ncbi:small integral membrane protein 29-like [Fundulus diaphanus]
MNLNNTTIFITTPDIGPEFPGYYALIPLVVLSLSGCIVAVVFHVRRRSRLDELRHRLIPLYTYDPAEDQEDWGDYDKDNEDEELAEPLCKESQLSFTSDH